MTDAELLKKAVEARGKSYSPYSRFRVGAALLTRSGKVYSGANIEIAAYSATICAERVALFKAVNEGERDFEAIAIVGGKDSLIECCAPCGTCRQALAEFCNGDLRIILGNEERLEVHTLRELLPLAFGPGDL